MNYDKKIQHFVQGDKTMYLNTVGYSVILLTAKLGKTSKTDYTSSQLSCYYNLQSQLSLATVLHGFCLCRPSFLSPYEKPSVKNNDCEIRNFSVEKRDN